MKSSAICREWLNSLPPIQGYLKKEQSIGRDFLFEKGMPSNKDEAWRLCNLNRIKKCEEYYCLMDTVFYVSHQLSSS